MTAVERAAGSVDLGCGAGEMLVPLLKEVTFHAAIDYSESMLASAREALDGSKIALLCADVFEYLPESSHPVWMTTGALNQYLPADELKRLVEIFATNETARALFLFDCIDPIRYRILPLGIGYRDIDGRWTASPTIRMRVGRLAYRLRICAALVSGQLLDGVQKLDSTAMGYAVMPSFWGKLCREIGLSIEMVSSRYYEYRYHVIIRKGSA